jgi:hypothetical protein
MKKVLPTSLATAEAKISALISSELEAKALLALEGALGAETIVRTARGENGLTYGAVPDHAIRLTAAVKIIEFSRGKPRQMIEVDDKSASKQSINLADLGKLIGKHREIADRVLEAVQYQQAIPVQAVTSESPKTS